MGRDGRNHNVGKELLRIGNMSCQGKRDGTCSDVTSLKKHLETTWHGEVSATV